MIPIPIWLQNLMNELWYCMMDSERKQIQELKSIRDQAIQESSMIDKKIENILNEVKNRKDRNKGQHNFPTSSHAYTPQLPNQSLVPYNVENGAPNQVAYQQPQLYQNQEQLALAHNQQVQSQNIQYKHNSKNEKKPKKKDKNEDLNYLIGDAVKAQSAIDEALQEQYRADSEKYCKPLSFKPLPISPVEDDNSIPETNDDTSMIMQELSNQREQQRKKMLELETSRKLEEAEKMKRLEDEYAVSQRSNFRLIMLPDFQENLYIEMMLANQATSINKKEMMRQQEISTQTALKSMNRPPITHALNSLITPTAVPNTSPFVPKLASADTVNYNDILKKREILQEQRLKLEEKAAEERLKKLSSPTSPTKFDLKRQQTYHGKEKSSCSSMDKGKSMDFEDTFMFVEKSLEISVPSKNEKVSVGFFGLRDSGKSRLIAALTGVDKAYLSKFFCIFVLRFLDTSNFVDMSGNARFYEINHPNGGFLDGSISGNRDIYQNFFEKSHLPNLSCLFITTNGQIREEDILVAQLAHQHNIPCAFLRTRSDEWLDSFCEKRTPNETIKNTFKEKDLKFVHDILFSVDTSLLNIPVFIISSLVFKNPTKMKNYMIDEGDFLKYLEKYNVCLSLEQGLTQPLASLKTQNVVNNSGPSPNIAFIGRITSGKSSLIDALRGITSSHPESATHKQSSEITIDGKTVVEITYSDLGPKSNFADDIVRKYNLTIKTKIYLVIGNAVGERDLWLARYFTQDGYPLFILLTQSDKHIDSNGENFTEETRNDYKINHLKAAKDEFKRFALKSESFQFFNICSPVIRDIVTNKSRNLHYQIDEENFLQTFKRC